MTQKQAKLIYGVGMVVTFGSDWKGAQGVPGGLVVMWLLVLVTPVRTSSKIQ